MHCQILLPIPTSRTLLQRSRNHIFAISSNLSLSQNHARTLPTSSPFLLIDRFCNYTAAQSPSTAVVVEYTMGNCQVCLSSGSVHDAGEDDSVKLVRVTDGQIFEYPGPVFVKDLMFGFEGFAVFHYSSIKQPLPLETELKFNEVYYLRPWTSPEVLAKLPDGGKAVPYAKLGCLRSPQHTLQRKPVQGDQAKVKKVRFVEDGRQETPDVSSRCKIFALPDSQQGCDSPRIAESPPSMELLPQQQNGVVRVKLVISKSQLSDLMATTKNADAVLESIIAPLLSPKSAAAGETAGSLSPKSSWKPALDHIPEEREARSYPLSLSSSRMTGFIDSTFLER